jgi:hypothetical protein
MHALLERVSLIFQHDGLSIGDVGAEASTSIEIAKLTIACGKWRAKHNFMASGQGYWAENSRLCHYM